MTRFIKRYKAYKKVHKKINGAVAFDATAPVVFCRNDSSGSVSVGTSYFISLRMFMRSLIFFAAERRFA